MRNINSTFKTEKNSPTNKPIFLYRIYDYDGSNDLLFAEYDSNVTFNGDVYTAFPITHEFIAESGNQEIPQIKVRASNVSRYVQAYLEQYDFRGKRVDIILVWANQLSNPDVKIVDTFYIDSYTANEQDVEFTLTSKFDVLDVPLPSGKYLRTHCRWVFKSTQCAYAGAEGSCNRTFQRCQELNNVVRFGGFPSIPIRRLYVAS
ncbi:MAG: DUF2163 domain-containing protein [Candidatus Omnitrophica bacterium]|nr:DUF2163 domain-containing protein [Candidatus Omnitrophota bacterium]